MEESSPFSLFFLRKRLFLELASNVNELSLVIGNGKLKK